MKPSPPRKLFMKKNIIDHLPEPLLVEILCRLRSNKLVFQCKCVSKRWLRLISDPCFAARFLCVQRDRKTPIPSTVVLFPCNRPFYEVFSTSDHPAFKKLSEKNNKIVKTSEIRFGNTRRNKKEQYASNLAFGFVPFYGGIEREPLVVGACNDLVCFCPNRHFPVDFYIINPYTKQWVALPTIPPVHQSSINSGYTTVGFICDPYYKDEQQICSATTSDYTFRVHAEYRWAFVQLVANLKGTGFHVHMLSSESPGEWRDLVVLCPRDFGSFKIDLNTLAATGVAHNGKLYWLRRDGFIFELDAFSSSNVTKMVGVGEKCIANCRFIEPEPLIQAKRQYLGVSRARGCLQLCCLCRSVANNNENNNDDRVMIWDLKLDEVPDQAGKFKWHKVPMQIPEQADLVREWATKHGRMVAFHPNNEDSMYLKCPNYIAECNFRGTMLEIESVIEHDQHSWSAHYPFAIPWWPTPVPRVPAFDSEIAMAYFIPNSKYAPCLL